MLERPPCSYHSRDHPTRTSFFAVQPNGDMQKRQTICFDYICFDLSGGGNTSANHRFVFTREASHSNLATERRHAKTTNEIIGFSAYRERRSLSTTLLQRRLKQRPPLRSRRTAQRTVQSPERLTARILIGSIAPRPRTNDA